MTPEHVVAQILPWEGTRADLLQQCSCFTHYVHTGYVENLVKYNYLR